MQTKIEALQLAKQHAKAVNDHLLTIKAELNRANNEVATLAESLQNEALATATLENWQMVTFIDHISDDYSFATRYFIAPHILCTYDAQTNLNTKADLDQYNKFFADLVEFIDYVREF